MRTFLLQLPHASRLRRSTLPVHLLDGPATDLQALGQFPLDHSLRLLHPDVLPLTLGQAGPPAWATPLGPLPSVPCWTSFWSALERSVWMNRPYGPVSQTRVCDTGPQFTPFSLFGRGSQRYSAMPTSWRESDARDLRLRPHQPPQGLRAVGQRPGNPVSSKMDLSHPAVVTSPADILWRYIKHIAEGGRSERDLRNAKGGPFHPGDCPTTGSVEIPGATTPEDFGCGGAAGECLQG